VHKESLFDVLRASFCWKF